MGSWKDGLPPLSLGQDSGLRGLWGRPISTPGCLPSLTDFLLTEFPSICCKWDKHSLYLCHSGISNLVKLCKMHSCTWLQSVWLVATRDRSLIRKVPWLPSDRKWNFWRAQSIKGLGSFSIMLPQQFSKWISTCNTSRWGSGQSFLYQRL